MKKIVLCVLSLGFLLGCGLEKTAEIQKVDKPVAVSGGTPCDTTWKKYC